MKLKNLVIIISLFILLLSFGTNAIASGYTIGFIPMTLSNEYFITMVNAAQQEADKLGVTLLVQAGQTHGSAAEQLELVENMINRNVNAICIVPSSSFGLIPALRQAEEAGIPVINLDTKLDAETIAKAGLKPIPFIGTDNYAGAQKAGERALELLNEGDKVAILTGIAGQQNTNDRRNGFYDVVKDKLEVVAEQTANWEVEEGYNVTENIITANPDLKLIFASNDNMALGACRALKANGREDVIVIGYDGIPAALESIEAGEMDSTVAQFPADMGIEGVRAAIALIEGKEVPDVQYTRTELITKENVEEFKEYLAQFE